MALGSGLLGCDGGGGWPAELSDEHTDCERQLLELEALQSIFTPGEELFLTSEETLALDTVTAAFESIADCDAGHFRWGTLPELGIDRVQFVLEGGVMIALKIRLPHGYPSHCPPEVTATVLRTCGGGGVLSHPLVSQIQADMNAQACLRVGSESLFFLIERFRDVVRDALEAHGALEAATKPPPPPRSRGGGEEVPEKATFGRRCIYFHHIIAQSKRQAVTEWAVCLGLSGCSKYGWPGVVVVEGEEGCCKEYCRALQRLRWKAMVVRGEEQIAIPPGSSVDCLRKLPRGFREFSDMSAAASYCREAGLEKLFKTCMKIYT